MIKAFCFVVSVITLLVIAFGSRCVNAATLGDLGYPAGITLEGRDSSSTVYFPLPPGATSARLTLDTAASALLGPDTGFTVSIETQPILTLSARQLGAPVSVPIPAALLHAPFLRVTFSAHQSAEDQSSCPDRSDSLWTWIRADTVVNAQTTAMQGVGAIWQQLGEPLQIALPAKPSLADIDAGLILATALVERGVQPSFGAAQGAAIRIDPTAKALGLEPDGDRTQIIVPSAAAARALVGASLALRREPHTTALAEPAPRDVRGGRASFGQLGLGSLSASVARSASIEIPLPVSALPADKHITALVLNGRGEALAAGETETVSVTLGNILLWSEAFRTAPILNGERINLPASLLANGSQPALSLQRSPQHRPCTQVLPLRFSLSDSSAVILAGGPPQTRRLAAFSASGGGAMPVLMNVPPAAAEPALPLIARLLAAAGTRPGLITTASGSAMPDMPFLLLSPVAVPVIASAPVPDPRTDLAFPLPAAGLRLTIPDASQRSLLQLVTTKTGISGLWLSPGPAASLAQAALPGDGDVALYDGSARPATFETMPTETLSPAIADYSAERLLRRWATELIALAWLIVLVGVVVLVVRRRKSG